MAASTQKMRKANGAYYKASLFGKPLNAKPIHAADAFIDYFYVAICGSTVVICLE